MLVGSFVSYTLISNSILYWVMSDVIYSTDQSVMNLPNLEVFKTEHIL